MRVLLNGERRNLPEGATLADLVKDCGLDGERRRGIAVAVDAEVVPRSAWERTQLSDGQKIELLTAIQGG
jgi:sulfur carrier protein